MKDMIKELGCKETEIKDIEDKQMTIMEFIPYIGQALGMEGHVGRITIQGSQNIIQKQLNKIKEDAGIKVNQQQL
jgi:hypothetical protein